MEFDEMELVDNVKNFNKLILAYLAYTYEFDIQTKVEIPKCQRDKLHYKKLKMLRINKSSSELQFKEEFNLEYEEIGDHFWSLLSPMVKLKKMNCRQNLSHIDPLIDAYFAKNTWKEVYLDSIEINEKQFWRFISSFRHWRIIGFWSWIFTAKFDKSIGDLLTDSNIRSITLTDHTNKGKMILVQKSFWRLMNIIEKEQASCMSAKITLELRIS
jgi:hypothetical protein